MAELPTTELFVICATQEVQEEEVRGFTLARRIEGKIAAWPIMITRRAGKFLAFENACPHDKERLDAATGAFLDEEANFLKCGKHGALFDIETGHCFIGPCRGEALTPIPLVIDDGDICLVDETLAEEDGLHLEEPDAHPEVMITSD